MQKQHHFFPLKVIWLTGLRQAKNGAVHFVAVAVFGDDEGERQEGLTTDHQGTSGGQDRAALHRVDMAEEELSDTAERAIEESTTL